MHTLIYPHSETAVAQPLRARSTTKYTQWVTPVQMLQLTGLVSLGQVYLHLAGQFWCWRRLPEPRRGRPTVYTDLTIWLTAVIQRL